VTEVAPLPTGFTFSQSTNGVCNLNAAVGNENYVCEVVNTITGPSTTIEGLTPPPERQISQAGVTQSQLATGIITAQAGTSTGAGQTLGLINPPFDVCKSNTLAANQLRATATGRTPETSNTELVRAPNSATYTAGGKVNLDDVMNALQQFNTKTFTIRIYSDIDTADQMPLAVSAPQFTGQIVVEDRTGADHEVENFDISTIRTECKYITLAKAAGNAPRNNVFPLGVLGRNTDTTPPEITELLVQQRENLLTGLASDNNFPATLNPPFAVCDVPETVPVADAAPPFDRDDIAIYNVRGQVKDLGSVSGNDLNLEINVDLNLKRIDNAKMTDNNNPFMRVNLVADEDEDSAHVIPFELHDLWTDCKDLALNNNFVFEPIQSEIGP
jgi:hypothetical protein